MIMETKTLFICQNNDKKHGLECSLIYSVTVSFTAVNKNWQKVLMEFRGEKNHLDVLQCRQKKYSQFWFWSKTNIET